MKNEKTIDFAKWHCPIPIDEYPYIVMAHGGGGKLTHQLLSEMFQPVFDSEALNLQHDGAVVDIKSRRIAFTTDSYVIKPLFFPGGDIGSLAVNGTINDLAMCGASPLCISVSFIIEEGFSTEILWKIVKSIKKSALEAAVDIVTGDTKVVDKNRGDGIYINTSGIGQIDHDQFIGPSSIRPGDAIIVSGDIGRHGMAIMSTRQGLRFETEITSDCAPLNSIIKALLERKLPIHCMRDLTRGGLTSALVEIAKSSSCRFDIVKTEIPVREEVDAACEHLGMDPLYVANEGRFVVFCPSQNAQEVLDVMRDFPDSAGARLIGEVSDRSPGRVVMQNEYGINRILEMYSGEQLPRIC